jgi:iron(II)-dependent oxidoreductase
MFYVLIPTVLLVLLLSSCSDNESIDNKQKDDAPDDASMALIPAGEFQMGSNDGEDDEKPVHTVYLDAFYMDVYEVTNAQYRKFVQATGHKEPVEESVWTTDIYKPWHDTNFNRDAQPVMCINWDDAVAYADWAGKRLPTEAEWEKAARGGLVGKKYIWGDEQKLDNCCGTSTSPVGSFGLAPNGYGLYDMDGNVCEWCADWYDENYYAISPKSNPTGPSSGSYRVIRGASFDAGAAFLCGLVAYRLCSDQSYSGISLGFRCVQDVPK